MADSLDLAWDKLTLTEEEAAVVVFEGDSPAEKEEEIALSLVGKLLCEGSFNARVMKTVLKNIWKPVKGVVIRDLASNLFVFQFFSEADKNFVLNEGPWAFDGHLLLLRPWTGLEQPSELTFSVARFWVKAYDVPGLRQTKAFAEFLGSQIGSFVDCEEANLLGADKALCFRVDVDVSKPLRRGVNVLLGGKPKWIQIKYVKLPDFCYGCGRLGHVLKGCDLTVEDSDGAGLQYGSWLRASPLRSKRRNAEEELLEERRLFLSLRDKAGAARKRLSFGVQTSASSTQRTAMAIDEQVTVVPGNEILKRKMGEGSHSAGSDKLRIVETPGCTVPNHLMAETAVQSRPQQ